MTWRDRLQPAKLGDAGFLVESAEAELGRNTQVHEYPLRDVPFVEDLGRTARRFRLSAYVIGPEYMTARDALIVEIEKPGPRTLVHPYLGQLTVSLVQCEGPRESTREGGMAWFAITFVETGNQQFPAAAVDTARNVAQRADVASAAIGGNFVTGFVTKNAPPGVLASATRAVQRFSDRVRELVQVATTLPAPISGFIAALNDLSGAVSTLILVPQSLVSSVMSLIQQLESIVEQPEFALEIVRGLFHFGSDFSAPSTTTPAGAQAAANQAAIVGLVQQTAIVRAAVIASQIQFTGSSFEDVTSLREELVTQIDGIADAVGDDELFTALIDVRSAITVDLERRAAPLARIVPVTLREPWPAIVLAYDLYENALRDAEIIARNGVRDPNFLPPNQTLQVLSDA
jgi:prophage DNA circulation protein